MKIYYESDAFNLKCIVSDVDGNKYCVRERAKLQLVADLLAKTTQKLKLMAIPSISTEKYNKLWKRLKGAKDKFQQKSIKGKNEKWHKH